MASSNIKALMPEYQMKCRKCKRVVPCHKIWLEKSKVLCPECYFKMPYLERVRFHKKHPDRQAEITDNHISVISKRRKIRQPESWSNYGSAMKSETIMRASVKDLIASVKSGNLSKVRFRIEMKRRQNKGRYNILPEVDEIQI